MKRVFVSLILMMIWISACAPQAQATEQPADVGEEPTEVGTELTTAQRAAISKLASNLGITPEKVELLSTEAIEWPDSCLGITREGMACAEVITPGFLITLEADGKQVEYHTNEDGTVVSPATVALTWERVGGIAGFCDYLTIYLSGEVQGSTCKQGEMVEKSVTQLLSREEIATMNEWVSRYGTVEVDASDPQGVADGMSVKLKLIGTGNEKMSSSAAQQILVEFVQELNQELMSK